MLWFLIVPVWGYFVFTDVMSMGGSRLDFMLCFFLSSIFTGFGALPCAGIAALLGFFFKAEPIKSGECHLAALRDKDGVSGQFFLGSGMIEAQPYFFYYKKRSDGGFQPGKVNVSSRVRIYEEDRDDALMVEWTWELTKPWAYLVAFPHNTGGWVCDFRVPKGTIRSGYSI